MRRPACCIRCGTRASDSEHRGSLDIHFRRFNSLPRLFSVQHACQCCGTAHGGTTRDRHSARESHSACSVGTRRTENRVRCCRRCRRDCYRPWRDTRRNTAYVDVRDLGIRRAPHDSIAQREPARRVVAKCSLRGKLHLLCWNRCRTCHCWTHHHTLQLRTAVPTTPHRDR